MRRRLLVVMGPSGAGKSRIGAVLASALNTPFFEGDDYHPQSNVEKMSVGIALSDEDRAEWIDGILATLADDKAPQAVLACSALTPFVQEKLQSNATHTATFILLEAPRSLLAQRIKSRVDHFMPVSLLGTQIEALEPPEDALKVNADEAPEAIVARLITRLDDKA